MRIERASSPALDSILGIPHAVLDHGFVRVIDYMGNDAAIVQAARVSYGEGTKTFRSDAGLIDYLMRNGHTGPLEQCEIKIHVKLPIFVARQWVRHRTASLNEVSARYSEIPSEHYVPATLRSQSKTNKQGSDAALDLDASPLHEHAKRSHELYTALLEEGVARELARTVLPVSVYTEWYWKCDLHNTLNFLRQRMDAHAQWEIRQYANVLAGIIKMWCPMTWASFEKHRL